MPLISQPLSNLFNGVSQQAAALRLPSQCEEQENAFSNIVEGLIKRPPTESRASLNLGNTGNVGAVTQVVSFEGVPYVLFISTNSIRVFDMLGNEKTVSKPNGVAYLNNITPRTSISTTTVADYTFIVNKLKTVAMDTTTTLTSEPPTAYVWVKTGVAEQTYTVNLGVVFATYTTGTSAAPTTWRTTEIAAGLESQINSLSGYVAERKGSVLKIYKSDSSDFDFSVEDSWGNQAQRGIKGKVQKFADLPSTFWENVTIEVEGINGDENIFDNMYVHWVKGTSTGTWKETVKPGLYNSLESSTMPHVLVKELNGTFTFREEVWDARKVGDGELVPEPSFVGHPINDVFFFKNRLGLLADENLILSRSGSYFNYWPETVSEILDNDPIDVSATNIKVSVLQHAVPFDESLLIFSKSSQFVLSHDGVISPKTVSLDIATEFESSLIAKPVGAGNNLYFVVERGKYSGIREYYVEADSVSNDASDITAHVPNYIPRKVFKLSAAHNDDFLLGVSSDRPNEVFVYKHYWDGSEKVQSSWSKWVLDTDSVILGVDVIDTEVVMIVQRNDDVYIEVIDIQAGQEEVDMDFLVHLDRKVEVTGVYNSGVTTFITPYTHNGELQVILGASFTGSVGNIIPTTKVSGNTLTIAGDYSTGSVFIGTPYTFRYKLSEQFAKDSEGQAILSAYLQLRRILLAYVSTGYFKVEVTPTARKTYTYIYSGKLLGTASTTLGKTSLRTGIFPAPIGSKSTDVDIVVSSDSYLPCQFQSAEYEAYYHSRSKTR